MAKRQQTFVFAAKGLAEIENEAKSHLSASAISDYLADSMELNKRQAASAIRQMKTRGILKPVKIDGTFTIDREILREFLEEDEQEQETEEK
jgi:hypothetical protein